MNAYNGFTSAKRKKAHDWLEFQFRKSPKQCKACGQDEGPIVFHTEDYSEPYGANIGEYELCYACHMMLLCRKGRMHNKWRNYKKKIKLGFRYLPVRGGWAQFKKLFLDGKDIAAPYVERHENDFDRDVLYRIEEHGRLVQHERDEISKSKNIGQGISLRIPSYDR